MTTTQHAPPLGVTLLSKPKRITKHKKSVTVSIGSEKVKLSANGDSTTWTYTTGSPPNDAAVRDGGTD